MLLFALPQETRSVVVSGDFDKSEIFAIILVKLVVSTISFFYNYLTEALSFS